MVHRVDFKAIKEAASFDRVLAHYGITHHGRGDQRKALCPFHNDEKPSLNVNLRKRVFNCYPCGDGGDIIKFVTKKEYPADPDGHRLEAAQKLAEICGIALDTTRPASAQTRPEKPTEAAQKDTAKPVPSTAAAPASPGEGESAVPNPPLTFELKVDPEHPYLAERDLTPAIIQTFGLGYCVSEKSMMRQRILIPIHNERGELIAYAGRWPGTEGWPEGTDKYMLPPKFQKTRVLYNLHRVIEGGHAGSWPGHERHIVLVEGFFGTFATHELAPCVALMGSSISPHHIELLREQGIRYVTLLLDGPSKLETEEQSLARDQKTSHAVHQLASSGLFVRAPKLGLGEQPDTINRDRLTELLEF